LVLAPFSMTNCTFSQFLSKEQINEAAFGYNIFNLQVPKGYRIMPELSAAGLWATPSDLARFGIEIMKALKGESSLIEKSTAKRLTRKVSKYSPFGVGFSVSRGKKGLIFGHSGSNIGYKSNMSFCPKDGSGIVVMQNSDIGKHICGEVTNAFREICGW